MRKTKVDNTPLPPVNPNSVLVNHPMDPNMQHGAYQQYPMRSSIPQHSHNQMVLASQNNAPYGYNDGSLQAVPYNKTSPSIDAANSPFLNEDEEGTDDKKTSTFLLKTFNMVSDPKNTAIVSWNSSGDEFVVRNEHEFASNILPVHFRHKNFSSFVRQLNFYGFSKRSTPNQHSHFKHACFRRGRRDLLPQIKRKMADQGQQGNVKDSLALLQSQVLDLQSKHQETYKTQQQIIFMLSKILTKDDSDRRLPAQSYGNAYLPAPKHFNDERYLEFDQNQEYVTQHPLSIYEIQDEDVVGNDEDDDAEEDNIIDEDKTQDNSDNNIIDTDNNDNDIEVTNDAHENNDNDDNFWQKRKRKLEYAYENERENEYVSNDRHAISVDDLMLTHDHKRFKIEDVVESTDALVDLVSLGTLDTLDTPVYHTNLEYNIPTISSTTQVDSDNLIYSTEDSTTFNVVEQNNLVPTNTLAKSNDEIENNASENSDNFDPNHVAQFSLDAEFDINALANFGTPSMDYMDIFSTTNNMDSKMPSLMNFSHDNDYCDSDAENEVRNIAFNNVYSKLEEDFAFRDLYKDTTHLL